MANMRQHCRMDEAIMHCRMDEAIIHSKDLYKDSAVLILVLWCSLQQTLYILKNGVECRVFIQIIHRYDITV
jgi:hypothetical protein